jgi:citrate lyase beta subunit
MRTSISAETLSRFIEQLARRTDLTPIKPPLRQPVHVVYGGANLFSAETVGKLSRLAADSFARYAPDADTLAEIFGISLEIAAEVRGRVETKLTNEAIEDYRIDFEDGYGIRPDDEEDRDAEKAALAVGAAYAERNLPPFIGIRVKNFGPEMFRRAVRTLDIFLTTLIDETGSLPNNFVVTLPKVTLPDEAGMLDEVLTELESRLGLQNGSVKTELMIETTRSIIAEDGSVALPSLVAASNGRCRGVHFGAYDYTADCGVTAAYQDLQHPACDFARHMMQASLAGTGVFLSDGATTQMPIAPHRGKDLTEEQADENRKAVRNAWRIHYDNCRTALANGFYQGWDLHPGQIPARYAAVFSFFLENVGAASNRLARFLETAARATLTGNDFDDAATGQGLLNFFLRAVGCGAFSEVEVFEQTGLSADELRSGSFTYILKNRG